MRVRIGIHTGEAIQQGGDFYGASVATAARIADHAEGGEILVSSLVKDLLGPAADVTLHDAGEAELKGLSGKQRLFRVAWGPAGHELPRTIGSASGAGR